MDKKKEIKAILVDDEQHGLETLSWQLQQFCPDVEIIGVYSDPKKAISEIKKISPSVVFLDIEMPGMNGFEFLEQFDSISFEVIFTTAYDEFAVKAFKVSALEYLLKPIIKDELVASVNKLKSLSEHSNTSQQIEMLRSVYDLTPLNKVALPTFEGLEFIEVEHIIRCEADDNYAHVHIANRNSILVSKTLKEIEELLSGHGFHRIHYSHLINLNKIKKYVKGDGGYVILDDDSTVNVSRSKKENFLKIFQRS